MRSTANRTDSEHGFSLIEVMVAMTILGIGLLSLAQTIPVGLASITQAQVRGNAIQAAQQRIDDLRSADFSSAALTPGSYTESSGNYSLAWTITDDSPVPGSKRIELTTSWQAVTGTKSTGLVTYVSKE